MVVEFEQRRKSQRLASQKKQQQPCTHFCGGTIAAEGTPGEPGYRKRAPLRREGHHALRLADEIQRSMESGKHGLRSRQKAALDVWETLCKDMSTNSLLERLGQADGSKVSEAEMRGLIRTFSVIFFRTRSADEEMNVRFTWMDWRDSPQEYGEYWLTDNPRICMCAFNYIPVKGYGRLNELAMDRLGTILHELVHAYLHHYACRCEEVLGSYEANVSQFKEHGLAWQRIAGSIERAALELLGYPIDLSRFLSLIWNWEDLRYWPSREEVEGWQLVYSGREEDEDEDMDKEVEGKGKEN